MTSDDQQPRANNTPDPTAWGQPISAERQAELQALLDAWNSTDSNHDERHSAFDGIELTGADVFWLHGKAEFWVWQDAPGLGDPWDLPTNFHLDGANLSGADLRGAHLSYAYLTHANLTGADFTNADLSDANLFRANLLHANLASANLTSAKFRLAALTSVDVRLATLTHADLSDAMLDHANLSSANLTNANLLRANLSEANLSQVNLSQANLTNANLLGANLTNANLSIANLSIANLSEANFSIATLTNANLTNANLLGANLTNANLLGATLTGADLSSATLDGANLSACRMDASTRLEEAQLDQHTRLADVVWNNVPVTRVDWSTVPHLGDEDAIDKAESPDRIAATQVVIRAYHGLAVVLGAQGLTDDAARLTYREQVLRRQMSRLERKWGAYFFSLLIAALSGYGFRLGRIVVAYVLIVTTFAAGFFVTGHTLYAASVSWQSVLQGVADAYQISLNAIHGRVFFAQFGLDTIQSWFATAESITGIIIEGVFVAMLIQRFFGK